MRAVPFLITILLGVRGFTQPVKDTLETAQSLVQQNQLIEAEKLLEAYHKTAGNPYSYQLHGQLLYWTRQSKKALGLYEKSIAQFPVSTFLRLDYGRTLFQLGKLKQAKEQLERYLQSDSLHAEAHIMLAYMEAWEGNAKAAQKRVNLLKKNYPANSSVKELAHYYNQQFTKSISAAYTYLSDDQPLQSNQFRAGYTAHHSALFSPFISGSFAQFKKVPEGVSTAWVQAGNLWQFGFGSAKIRTAAGVFANRQTGSLVTGELSLRQKLSGALSIDLAAVRQPYQYTLSSVENPFLYNAFSGALQFDRKHVLGTAGAEVQSFNDGNKIATVYAWALFPLIKLDQFTLKAGYSYSYSNADRTSFAPAKTVAEAAQTQNLYTQIQGFYAPYFTPINQQVHALLVNIGARIHPNFRIQGSASFGFSASADNPYFLLEKRGNNFLISRNFYQQAYTPVDVEIGMETALSSPLSLQLKYKYSRLFFYTRNLASAQLNYRLIK